MRTTGDLADLLMVKRALEGNYPPLAALGRLVSNARLELFAGSPLVALCHGTPIEDQWRAKVGDSAASLWGELDMLRVVYGPITSAGDPLTELLELRDIADSDLNR